MQRKKSNSSSIISAAFVRKKPRDTFKTLDAFVILLLILMFPVGFLLMWFATGWNFRTKILLTVFGPLGIGFISLFALSVLGSLHPKKPPPPLANPFTFTKLANNYSRASSEKYRFSFEFPSNLQYKPVSLQVDTKEANMILFNTENRYKNDPESNNFANFEMVTVPKGDGNPCITYPRINSNWKPTSINGYEAIQSRGENNQTTLICYNGLVYSFDYNFTFEPRRVKNLTSSDIAFEKESVNHMLNTFQAY